MIPPMSFDGVILPDDILRSRPFWSKYGWATAHQFGHMPVKYSQNFALRLYQLYYEFFRYIEIPHHWHMHFNAEPYLSYGVACDKAWNAGVSKDAPWFKALCCTGFMPMVSRVYDEDMTTATINVSINVAVRGPCAPPVPPFLADYYKETFG